MSGKAGQNSGSTAYDTYLEQSATHITGQEALLALLESLEPDVICLQEVTPEFLSRLAASPPAWLAAYVVGTAAWAERGGSYGTLTIARAVLKPSFSTIALPTYMGRDLLVVCLELPGGSSGIIGNVHLESLSNAAVRSKQLAVCARYLAGFATSLTLLCGDFNFCSWCNYSELPQSPLSAVADGGGVRGAALAHPPSLPLARPKRSPPLENELLAAIFPGWVDSWQAVHPLEHGFTFDTVANAMLGGHRYERMRYDRILVRLPDLPKGMPPIARDAAAEISGSGSLEAAAAGSSAVVGAVLAPCSDVPSSIAAAATCPAVTAEAPSHKVEGMWGLAGVQIVGSTALPSLYRGRPVLISDHFGLSVDLVVKF